MTVARPAWLRRSSLLPRLAGQFLRWGAPRRALLFGPLSLGDDLLCTAVLREARRRGTPFAMLTARPELFAGNPDPSRVLPIDDYYVAALRRTGARVVQPYYTTRDPANPDRHLLPPRHIVAEMCRLAGLTGRVALRPYLQLSAEEVARGRLHPRQIAIHSTGAGAAIPYANKEWGAANFTAVARMLAPDFHLVQLGRAGDPALPVATDLRGRTSLRETAAVLASSDAFVGLEGFLVHLARAVECRAVVVFGGRARPDTFGYTCNRNLVTAVSCSPCGLVNTCDRARECLSRIEPPEVAAAARELARLPRAPLPVDTADLPSGPAS
ncbi:MAG: hypothetical protein HZA93_25435 [Verrucomicrobia bacterium]|nr:hypothetical protein [Verrucomicrobiota bacterium]